MSHPLKLCSVTQLKTEFGIPYSRQHLWRLQGSGQFPRAVKLGQCRVAFRVCDIEEWIQARLESVWKRIPSEVEL
jgi:predicted DNA-binding transcriptional regulator AlpA